MMIMMNAMSKVVQLVITTDLFLSNTVISSFPKLCSRVRPFGHGRPTKKDDQQQQYLASHSISSPNEVHLFWIKHPTKNFLKKEVFA